MRLHYLQGMIPTEDDEAEEQVLEVIDGTKEYLELNRSGTNSCYMYSTGNIHPVVRLFSSIQLHLCLAFEHTMAVASTAAGCKLVGVCFQLLGCLESLVVCSY